MSTESTVDYTAGLPEGGGAAVVAVCWGWGWGWAPLEESPSCSILWLGKHTELAFFLFFPSSSPARRVMAY